MLSGDPGSRTDLQTRGGAGPRGRNRRLPARAYGRGRRERLRQLRSPQREELVGEVPEAGVVGEAEVDGARDGEGAVGRAGPRKSCGDGVQVGRVPAALEPAARVVRGGEVVAWRRCSGRGRRPGCRGRRRGSGTRGRSGPPGRWPRADRRSRSSAPLELAQGAATTSRQDRGSPGLRCATRSRGWRTGCSRGPSSCSDRAHSCSLQTRLVPAQESASRRRSSPGIAAHLPQEVPWD